MTYITSNQILFNPKDGAYGAKGDGTTDDYTALFNANAAAVTAGSKIYLTKGIYRIGSDITLSGFIAERGAILKPDANAVITITGAIEAPPDTQLFDLSNSPPWGTVDLFEVGQGSLVWFQYNGELYVEWFGAKCDGTTNDTFAVQKAHDALRHGGTLLFPSNKSCAIGPILYIYNNSVKLQGMSPGKNQGQSIIIAAPGFIRSLIWCGHPACAQSVVPIPIIGSDGYSLRCSSASANGPIINLTDTFPGFPSTDYAPTGKPQYLDGQTKFSFSGLWRSAASSQKGSPIFGSSGDLGWKYSLAQAIATTSTDTSIDWNCNIKDGAGVVHRVDVSVPTTWIDGYSYQYAIEIDCVSKKIDGYVYNFDTATLHSNSTSFSGLSGSCSISQQWYEVFYVCNYSLTYQWTSLNNTNQWYAFSGQDGYMGPFRISATTYYDTGFTPVVSNAFSSDAHTIITCNFDQLSGPAFIGPDPYQRTGWAVGAYIGSSVTQTGTLPIFGQVPVNIEGISDMTIEDLTTVSVSLYIQSVNEFRLINLEIAAATLVIQCETEDASINHLTVFGSQYDMYCMANFGWVIMESSDLIPQNTATGLINCGILYFYDMLIGEPNVVSIVCTSPQSYFVGDFLNFDNEEPSPTMDAGTLVSYTPNAFIVRGGTWLQPNTPSFVFSNVLGNSVTSPGNYSIQGGHKQFSTQPFVYIDPNAPMNGVVDVDIFNFQGTPTSLTNDARYVTFKGQPIQYVWSPKDLSNNNVNFGNARDVLIGAGASGTIIISGIQPPNLAPGILANNVNSTLRLQNLSGLQTILVNQDSGTNIFNQITTTTGSDINVVDQVILEYMSPGRTWGATTGIYTYIFSSGETVQDGNGHWFQTLTGGTTGSTTPSWNTTTQRVSTTTDGTITWIYMGNVGWRVQDFGTSQIPPTDTFILTYNATDNQWEPLPGLIDGYASISSITPTVGDFSGGTDVIISGAGFSLSEIASVGNVHLTNFLIVNDHTITGTTGYHSIASALPVYVTNGSNGTTILPSAYEYFNPMSSIPSKIYMWLRADRGTTISNGTVTHWTDQTSNAFDFFVFAINAPTLTASAINNKPALTFAAASTQGLFNNTFGSPTVAHAFVVARGNQTEPPSPSQGLWYNGTGTTGFQDFSDGNIYENFGSTVRYNTSGGTSSHPDMSQPFIYEIQTTNSSYNVFMNNINIITSGTNTVGWPGFFELGWNGINYYNGYIAEVIIYDQILTTDERDRVNSYLSGRYGITL